MSVVDQLGGPAARGPLPGTGGSGGGGGGLRGTAARYALLPLRLLLGLTFLYAGIDKYVDSAPFSTSMNTDTMQSMLKFSKADAATPWLADLALDQAFLSHVTAVGEIAVGLGVLFGLLTRVAAAGGALLSLSFWLTVSWSADPYYFGADLPYLIGFLTLVLTGSGPLAADEFIRSQQSRRGHMMFG